MKRLTLTLLFLLPLLMLAGAQAPMQYAPFMARAAVASSSFSPSDISGLDVWLESTGETHTDGSLATNWVNRVDAARPATAASSYGYWTNTSLLGGKAGIQFTNAGLWIGGTRATVSALTVFIVSANTGTGNYLFSLNAANGQDAFGNTAGPIIFWASAYSQKTITSLSGVFVARINSTSSVDYGNNEGPTRWGNTDPHDGYNTDTKYGINTRNASGNSLGAISICPMFLIYTNALSDSQINQVGRYCATNYGFTWTDK